MGFPVEQFIDSSKINEEFLCSICHDVLQDPTMTNPCEHTFCGKCIHDWQEREQESSDKRTCPIPNCRETIVEFRRLPRPFLSMLNALEIVCLFQSAGCDMAVKLGDYVQHSEVCEANSENRISCAGGCGAVLKKASAQNHSCVDYLMSLMDLMKVTASEAQLELLKKNDQLLNELQTTREELEVTKCKLETMQFPFGKPKMSTFVFKPNTTDSNFRNPDSEKPTIDLLSLGCICLGTAIKFEQLYGIDNCMMNGQLKEVRVRHQCIATSRNYNELKSLEELRWEDYQLGRINLTRLRLSSQVQQPEPCNFPPGVVVPLCVCQQLENILQTPPGRNPTSHP